MKKRVSWFDKADINPDDTYEEFIKSHGWFSISEDKKQLLVLSCVAVFQYHFCSLFNHNSSTFLNESEDQHPLSQVRLRICHVSGVSTPVPTQLTGNAGNLTIRGNGDYFGAQIGTGVDRTLIRNFFCLIALSMLRISVSQPGLVWVQLATLFDGIVERPFFRKEIPRGTSTTQDSDVIPSGVSEDSRWPFGVSSDEEWWVNNAIPSSSNRWGSAIEEWAGETA